MEKKRNWLWLLFLFIAYWFMIGAALLNFLEGDVLDAIAYGVGAIIVDGHGEDQKWKI